MDKPVLEVTDLNVSFGDVAGPCAGVSYAVRLASVLGIVGRVGLGQVGHSAAVMACCPGGARVTGSVRTAQAGS
ncbi:hypothetical protein GCM10020220_091480 [Nonomuraea rubra]